MTFNSPLEIWQEKLEYLQVQEAIATDPSVKFKLKADIEECKEQIKELGNTNPISENPFEPTTGTINPELLFNYKSIISEVFENLNAGGSVALIGETGMGKSSLLEAIKQQAIEKLKIPRKPIYFNLSEIQDDDDYYQAMKDLLRLPEKVKGYDFVQQVKRQGEKFLLLLDKPEQLTWTGFTLPVRRQLRGLASDGNPPPFRLVLATNKNLSKLFADSGCSPLFEGIYRKISLPPWEEDTMRQFINSRLATTSVDFVEKEIKLIVQKSKGNPRLLMQECNVIYRKYTQS
jgi:ABC-type dipeptide/oligopeptide/nickel transport system ATPase component